MLLRGAKEKYPRITTEILQFIDQYSEKRTWSWVRLFKVTALQQLSVRRNSDFAIVCAILARGAWKISDNTWKFPQFKNY